MSFYTIGPVSATDFDQMIAESMKEYDDDDVSDTEDPDLMVSIGLVFTSYLLKNIKMEKGKTVTLFMCMYTEPKWKLHFYNTNT